MPEPLGNSTFVSPTTPAPVTPQNGTTPATPPAITPGGGTAGGDGFDQAVLAGLEKVIAVLADLAEDNQLADAGLAFKEGRWMDGANILWKNEAVRTRVAELITTTQPFAGWFASCGLTKEAILAAEIPAGATAGEGAEGGGIGKLMEAATLFAEGEIALAIDALRLAAPEFRDAAVGAAVKIAGKLPESDPSLKTLKLLLSNADVVGAVFDLATDPVIETAYQQLVAGKHLDGIRSLVGSETVRHAVVTTMVNTAPLAGALKDLGMTAEDLEKAAAGIPDLLEGALLLSEGKWPEGLQALRRGAKHQKEIALDALVAAAGKLPSGTGTEKTIQALLKDRDFAGALLDIVLDDGVADAFALIAAGKLDEAADALAGNEALLEAAATVLSKVPAIREALIAAGFAEDELADILKDALGAADDFIAAGRAAEQGDWKEVAASLIRAAGDASPLIEAAIRKLAAKLTGTSPAESILKALLSNEKVVHQLVLLATDGTLEKVIAGDYSGALADLKDNKPLRDAIIDVLAAHKLVKPILDGAKITAAQLKEAGDAISPLIGAVEAVLAGDFGKTLSHLNEARQVAPELITGLIQAAAAKLPPEMKLLKDVLSRKGVAEALAGDEAFYAALELLAANKLEEGLRALAETDLVREILVGIALQDPIGPALKKVGLTEDDLQQAGRALPDLIRAGEAFSAGKMRDGLAILMRAGRENEALITKTIVALSKKLGDSPEEQVFAGFLGNEKLVAFLVGDEKLHEALLKFAEGDGRGGIDALLAHDAAFEVLVQAVSENEALRNLVFDKLNPILKDNALLKELEALGFELEDLEAFTQVIPNLLRAARALADGDMTVVWAELKEGFEVAGPAIEEAIPKLAAKIPDNDYTVVFKALLTDKNLVHDFVANVGNPPPHGAIEKIFAGQALEGLYDLYKNETVRNHVIDAWATNEKVQELVDKILLQMFEADPNFRAQLAKLGFDEKDIKAIARTMPALMDAAAKLTTGNVYAAIGSLDKWFDDAPDLVIRVINQLASYIPEEGYTGILRSLLVDPVLVRELVRDPSIRQAWKEIAKGNIVGGMDLLLRNVELAEDVVYALSKNKQVNKLLEPLGITIYDLPKIGDFLGKAQILADAARKGDIPEIFEAVVGLLQTIPKNLWRRMVEAILTKLDLPFQIGDVLAAGVGVLTNDEALAAFGKAFDHFAHGRPVEFVDGIGEAVIIGAKTDPDAAIAFLNALGLLPGSVGKFFTNKHLNESLVRSGHVDDMLQAMKALVRGDMNTAFHWTMEAARKLISHGTPIELPGVGKLPFTLEGTITVFELIFQMWNALPEEAQQVIIDAGVTGVWAGSDKKLGVTSANAVAANRASKQAVALHKAMPFLSSGVSRTINYIPYIRNGFNAFIDGYLLGNEVKELAEGKGDPISAALYGTRLGMDALALAQPQLDPMLNNARWGLVALQAVTAIGGGVMAYSGFAEDFAGFDWESEQYRQPWNGERHRVPLDTTKTYDQEDVLYAVGLKGPNYADPLLKGGKVFDPYAGERQAIGMREALEDWVITGDEIYDLTLLAEKAVIHSSVHEMRGVRDYYLGMFDDLSRFGKLTLTPEARYEIEAFNITLKEKVEEAIAGANPPQIPLPPPPMPPMVDGLPADVHAKWMEHESTMPWPLLPKEVRADFEERGLNLETTTFFALAEPRVGSGIHYVGRTEDGQLELHTMPKTGFQPDKFEG
jgi:hypothetical protein